jgi:hypothetical protein
VPSELRGTGGGLMPVFLEKMEDNRVGTKFESSVFAIRGTLTCRPRQSGGICLLAVDGADGHSASREIVSGPSLGS